jgi:ABC-2 type transport system permease protein
VRGKDPASVLPQIGILLAFTVVLSAAAAALFRWEEV